MQKISWPGYQQTHMQKVRNQIAIEKTAKSLNSALPTAFFRINNRYTISKEVSACSAFDKDRLGEVLHGDVFEPCLCQPLLYFTRGITAPFSRAHEHIH